MSDTTTPTPESDLRDARSGQTGHFSDFVREMLAWDVDTLHGHIRAMERRAIIHDDPGCLATADIARALLAEQGVEVQA